MMAFLQRILAQFLAALLALLGITAGTGGSLPPPAEDPPPAVAETAAAESPVYGAGRLAALWAGREVATLAEDWRGGAAAKGGLASQSLPSSGGNFGAQLDSGRTVSIYQTLTTITPAGFDAASLPGADPNYVPYAIHFLPGDYLNYNRAVTGVGDSGPTTADLADIGRILQPQMQAALEAFGRDYPEIFWLALGDGGTAFVLDGDYVVNGSILTITVVGLELRARVKAVYAGVVAASAALLANEVAPLIPPPMLGFTRQETVRAFHDAIIARVGSRIEYFSERADDATGPLLREFAGADAAPFGSALGFAKAFKLLCDTAGIPCVVVSGVRTFPNTMPHVWNAVQMEDNQWYAVDTLMDNGNTVTNEATYFEYLLAGSNTVDFSFGREPFWKSHQPNGYFTPNNYFQFSYPALSPTRYVSGLETLPLENALLLDTPYAAYCYTALSLQKFYDAKQAGEELMSKPGLGIADQELVDAAAAAIVMAYSDLVALPILRARPSAQSTVSFAYHQVTLSRRSVLPSVLLTEEVESGIAGAQLSVTLAKPQYTYVGTGATVTVTWVSGGETRKEVYTVLLLGDTNGDGLVNGEDVQVVGDIYTFAITSDPAGDYAVIMKADESRATGSLTLPTVTPLGVPVKGVSSDAFLFCNNVTEIVVPDCYTAMGSRCFYFMSGLERLVLGMGVTELPEDMCYMNGKLREVVFEGDVVNVGKRAFGECVSLQNVALPSSVQTIGREAFAGCAKLRSITLADGLLTIGINAFQRCAVLGDIIMPNSLTEIGAGAFANAPEAVLVCGFDSTAHKFALKYGIRFRLMLVLQGLEIRALPRKLIYYTGDAFSPQGMEVYALYDNGGELLLSYGSYSIPNFDTKTPGVKTLTLEYQGMSDSFQIRVYAFQYSLIDGNNSAMVTRYVGLAADPPIADAVIPLQIEGKPVTYVGSAAFAGCAGVTSVAIPDSVVSIQTGAFDGASGLLNFEVASGSAAYSAADGLLYDKAGTKLVAYPAGRADTDVGLPLQVTSVAARAFSNTGDLRRLYTGVSAAAWATGAVYNCPNLTLMVYEFTTAHFYAQQDSVKFQLVASADQMLLTPPTKQNYIVREPLDTTGMVLRLHYPDEALYTIPSGYTLSNFSNVTSGVKTITVTFQRFTATFQVTVVESDNNVYRYEILSESPKTAKLTRYTGTGGDLAVPAAIDGYTVTTLGQGLYDGVTTITSIVVPSSVTKIENRVFAGCTRMARVTLPATVTSIGDEAFTRCAVLESVVLPQALVSLGSYAFAECAKLAQITLPDGLVSVGSYAFSGCAALQEIAVGSALTSLGNYAFTGCAALQNVTVAPGNPAYKDVDGVLFNKAGDTLLRYPQGRTAANYTVPTETSAVGLGAFSGVKLQRLYMYRTVTSIASTALSGASSSLLIYCYRDSPAHVFAQQYGVMYSLLANPQPDSITVTAPPTQTSYYVGDTLNTAGLKVRANYPDGTYEDLKSGSYTLNKTVFASGDVGTCAVTVSYTVTVNSVTVTRTATFAVTVQEVPTTGFVYSLSGTELTITGYNGSDTVIRIPSTGVLSGVTRPVVAIGNGVFDGKAAITRVIIPPTIRSIGSRAFRNCASLQEVVLPDNLTALSDELFRGCTSLVSVNMPASLISIGEDVFNGCKLKYLPLPAGLKTITAYAFNNMPNLKHLSIPAGVTNIGTGAFMDCPALQTVFFPPAAAPSMDWGLFTGGTTNVRPLALAGSAVAAHLQTDGATRIAYTVSGDWAYGAWPMASGTRVAAYLGTDPNPVVPEKLGGNDVVGIMPHAFFNNQALQSVDIHEACVTVGNGAFALCANLLAAIVRSERSTLAFGDADVFYGCPDVTIYGFAGSRAEAYANQYGIPFEMIVIEYFHYVDNHNPFQALGETAEGYRMIAGFTPAYDTVAKARAVFALLPGEQLVFRKADGVTALDESARLGTGAQIQLYDSQSKLLGVLIVVYYGDVSGDGWVNALDALLLDMYQGGILLEQNVSPAVLLAMDVNHDGQINATDFLWLSQSGLGTREISQEATW